MPPERKLLGKSTHENINIKIYKKQEVYKVVKFINSCRFVIVSFLFVPFSKVLETPTPLGYNIV